MTKTVCTNCQTAFPIHDRDVEYYATMNVPAPTRCPQCRFQRRLMFRNERNLYSRNCAACDKSILSIYSSDKPYVIYCRECWWSDAWNPLSFGKPVDFSRPFFEQLHELRLQVARIALLNDSTSENSEYANHVYRLKNCYMVFDANDNEGCIHSTGVYNCKDLLDCMNDDNIELCYETLYAEKCYGLKYSRDTINCRDSAFLVDCIGVSNSLLCVGLRNKEFCYKNQQLTEIEFKRVWEKTQLHTRSGVKKAAAEFDTFLNGVPRKFYHGVNNEDVSGDYLVNSKSVHYSFETRYSEKCTYCFGIYQSKDCMDYTIYGEGAELVYETHCTGGNVSRILFSNIVWGGKEAYYCDNALNAPDNCFGCVGIKKEKYCILNTQYTEAEYIALRDRLIDHMKNTGEWGEFFPADIAPFGYNETMANEFFPLTKDQALQKGYSWQDKLPGTYGKETITSIPDSISDCTDQILKEVLACANCQRNYKIVKAELDFYRQQHIPIPDTCPDCRHLARAQFRSGYQLTERRCMCTQANHTHPAEACPQVFSTAYPETSTTIIYCEDCYRKETY